MRITLSDDEATALCGVLDNLWADPYVGDLCKRLADRIMAEGAASLTAILSPMAGDGHGPECEDCGAAIEADGDGWRHADVMTAFDHPADPGPLVPTCPACGNQAFSYMEGCIDYRPGDEVGVTDGDGGGTVTVWWSVDGTAESGDGDPGLFCDNWRHGGCGAPIDLPDGWEVEFQ